MEIRNLQTFLQVASIKNFTQAARILGYSQSNVSAQIHQLEAEVGAPLFNRIGKQITLTQYGEQLLPYAHQIVSTSLVIENFLKSKESLGGTVRFGMVESLSDILVQPVLLAYHQTYPHVHVELVVDDTAALEERLQQGDLDFACIIDEPLEETSWQIWYKRTEAIGIVCRSGHRLAGLSSLCLADIKDEEFILMERSAPYSVAFANTLARHSIRLQTAFTLQSADMALQLVKSSNLLSVLPLYTVRNDGTAAITVLPVHDFKSSQDIQLVLHQNKVLTPQIEGLLTEIRNVIEDKSICF